MAGGVKKTSGNGKTGSRKSSSGSRNTQGSRSARVSEKDRRPSSRRTPSGKKYDSPEESVVARDLKLILLFAGMIFLFLSNFGMMGPIGKAVSSVMFGIFGTMAYITPVLIFILALFAASNTGDREAAARIGACSALFFMLCMIFELFDAGLSDGMVYNIREIYLRCAQDKQGGGIIAGSAVFFLYKFLKLAGTILILLLIFLISMVILTRRSIVNALETGAYKMRDQMKDQAAAAREQAMLRREQREARIRAEREAVFDEEIGESESEEIADDQIRSGKRKFFGVTMQTLSAREEDAAAAGPLQAFPEHISEETELPAAQKEFPAAKFMPKENVFYTIPSSQEPVKNTGENPAPVSRVTAADAGEGKQPVPSAIPVRINDDLHEIHLEDIVTAPLPKLPPDMSGSEEYTLPGRSEEYVHPIHLEDPSAFTAEESSAVSFTPCREPEAEEVTSGTLTMDTEDSYETAGEVEKTIEDAKKPKEEAVVQAASGKPLHKSKPEYVFPPLSLLQPNRHRSSGDENSLRETAMQLQETLRTFGVNVSITEISQGPAVTRYELLPEQGVKVSKIVSLQDDIKMRLAATDIRIEAPIPGKAAIGIEVPNKENSMVALREILESGEYQSFKSSLAFPVGKDIGGKSVVFDIGKMPHVLIAGATGSGKSVCINTIIMGLLYKARPEDVKLIMIDPKIVELSVYNGIPHLMIPVVTDPKKASAALNWAVVEMNERYKKFADARVRDLKGYNEKARQMAKDGIVSDMEPLPQLVIIVDELADLMMVCANEVEESICRLAQLARAAGIHLIIATQRPSVDVITGLIKANMPSRIAFAVTSGIDSRTILDMVGAEKLLGKGDMLFYPQGYTKPARVQGAFVSDQEVGDVVNFLKDSSPFGTDSSEIEKKIESFSGSQSGGSGLPGGASGEPETDEYFIEAGKFIIEKDKASIGLLQRVFKIGFNRAARIMDQLCDAGVVGEEEGTKARKILMTKEEFEQYVSDM